MTADTDGIKKQATRIFKKSTPNGRVTVYLGKRDFIDHLSHVDPIEGVVLVDPEYVRNRKVFISLVGAFKDCRLDFDSMGITFCQNLYQNVIQVYPSNCLARGVEKTNGNGITEVPTKLQSRLIRKLGPNAHPFYFELPAYSPASVTMMLTNYETTKPVKNRQQNLPCRVDYELKTFVADSVDSVIQKRNSVKMTIRKLTYAPNTPGLQPRAEINKDFLISQGTLKIEASLDKDKYFHGEDIVINLLADNNSNKSIKRVKITVRQYSKLQIQNTPSYCCTVAEINTDEGFPIQAYRIGWCKVFRLRPSLTNNREKFGIAMDGDLKHEDTNLASSTILNPKASDTQQMQNLGIVVSYKVKIKLQIGVLAKDVSLELPFILTHPHPEPLDANNSDIDEIDIVEPVPHPVSHKNITSNNQSSLEYFRSNHDHSPPSSDLILMKNGFELKDHRNHKSLLDQVPIDNLGSLIQSNNPFLNDILVPEKVPFQTNGSHLFEEDGNQTSLDLLTDHFDESKNPFELSEPGKLQYLSGPLTTDQQNKSNPTEKSMDDIMFDNFARNRLLSIANGQTQ